MRFSPIAPFELSGEIKKELLIKAENICEESIELLSGYDKVTIDEFKEMLRIVNCYYSNKIESEGTHPVDIEKAMNDNFSSNPKNKDLQHLALAYIEAQKLLEDLHDDYSGFDEEMIKEAHRCIYGQEGMESFLDIEHKGEIIKMVPGEFREHDVEVGEYLAPEHTEVKALIGQYESAYKSATNFGTKAEKLIYILASHHRFVWIHPFIDGNGRASRILLDSLLYNMHLKGYGLWNISRGLARENKKYKSVLKHADEKRTSDLDGRGMLSSKALYEFVDFMLDICLDQIRYMKQQLRLSSFKQRLEYYIDDINKGRYSDIKPLPKHSYTLLKEIYERGEIKRNEVLKITGLAQTKSSLLIKELIKREYIQSDTPRGNLRVKVTTRFAMGMFLELIPEM